MPYETGALAEAARLYRQVLERQPDNEVASAGIEQIFLTYLRTAGQAIQSVRLDEAQRTLALATALMPNSERLVSVRSALTDAKQKEQARKGAERARAEQVAETRSSWNRWDVVHSCAIVGFILVFYAYFW